jgi:hypothetical protein
MRSICSSGPLQSGRGSGSDEWTAVITVDDEARLWALMEAAWAPLGAEVNQVRHVLAARPPSGQLDDLPVLKNAREAFLDSLTSRCRELTGEELIALDRVVERKLYDIDSADLHAVTGGSDDGFLYARGFIVAMGRRFYYAVAADLRMAVPWAEFEEMCYFFAHLHVERCGSFPDTGSGISRESCSNPTGWPR